MKIPIKTKKHFRRHFQLLELMVAVFILLLCIAPTMRIFTNIFLTQQEIIRENQKNHLMQLVHAKVTEMLYKRQIPLEMIRIKKPIILNDYDPALAELIKKSFFECSGTFTIERARKASEQSKPIEYLCRLELNMKDLQAKKSNQSGSQNDSGTSNNYIYYTYIDTQTNEGEDDEDEEDNGADSDDDENGEDGNDVQASGKKAPLKPPPKKAEARVAKGLA